MMKPILTVIAILLCILSNPLLAQEENQETIDRDFAFQGEYVGMLGMGEQKLKTGVQVIATGDGTFSVAAYHGGLPGAGWDGEPRETVEVVGKYNSDKEQVEFIGYAKGNATIKDGVMSITTPDNQPLGELKKITRKSETLGEEAPDGATVLFDGSNADGWKNGKMTEDGLLKQGTTSKSKFGDHKIHIEFQLPFMPNAKGQQRGNSGIYVQGRFEVQMLDSFGLDGKQNECGGIYSVKAPDLNMCLPPKSWQTYDIDFQAARYDEDGNQTESARMTVKHNGVLIHDNVELPARKTTAAPVNPSADPGPIFLQNHGNEVRYRNIWVVEK